MEPGTVLAGRFEVDGPPLGSGASGVVYPAIDRATGRKVAAKLLHAAVADDRAALGRLQDEAAIAGRLRHPNVVEVLGLWSDGGRWVLVSDRVDGVALGGIGPLAPAAVAALGLELVAGLDAAAHAGLVHGDVRPGNVLVGATGGARLFDFGVSRVTAEAAVRPGETAPERIDGGPPSPAGDVYGLGVVLYHALHGRLPFAGDTPWAMIGAQRAPVSAVPGPPGLAGLIRWMLNPNPIERPDLATVRRALGKLRARPERRIGLRWPLPPVRVRSEWSVWGTYPATQAPAVVATGMSRRAAHRLATRLRAEGWQVRGVRTTFGWRDLGWIAAGAVVG
ncbi:MAG: serine/threonine-protein kinase, partial [Myxococcota bacterium]